MIKLISNKYTICNNFEKSVNKTLWTEYYDLLSNCNLRLRPHFVKKVNTIIFRHMRLETIFDEKQL